MSGERITPNVFHLDSAQVELAQRALHEVGAIVLDEEKQVVLRHRIGSPDDDLFCATELLPKQAADLRDVLQTYGELYLPAAETPAQRELALRHQELLAKTMALLPERAKPTWQ